MIYDEKTTKISYLVNNILVFKGHIRGIRVGGAEVDVAAQVQHPARGGALRPPPVRPGKPRAARDLRPGSSHLQPKQPGTSPK